MSFINYKVTGWGWPGYTIATGGNNLTGVVDISAGYFHSLALLHNGKITGWGYNYYGESNNNNLTGVTGISAGYGYSLVVFNDGTITGWGYNTFGVARSGNSLTGVKKVLASKFNSLALLNNGTVTGWGRTGYGFTSGGKDLTGVIDIQINKSDTGYNWALALLNNGTITGWGYNDGNNNLTGGNNLTGVSGIAIGYAHTLALLNNGIVTGWGIDGGGGESTGNRSNVKQIQAGYKNNLALLNNKKITGWGTITDGRDWSITKNLRNVEKISYGYLHGLALIPYFSPSSSSSSSSYNEGQFEYNTGLFELDHIEIVNKKIKPVFDTGIYNYTAGQININENINKYISVPVSGENYFKLAGYKILNDISFIPLKSYAGHIYTGLYSGKEPIEYEVDIYGIPKVTGEIILEEKNYINYIAKNYRYNTNDPYYQKFLPKTGEKHILLLDLNFYGFEEDSFEDCDIELNSLILKTGFFKDIPKNPSILNVKILDLVKPIGITDNVYQYKSKKRILQNFEATNSINYDSSYYLNQTSQLNLKYKFLKNEIIIAPPLISNKKNIALPCLFQYKSKNNNQVYDIGEYKFMVFDNSNNYLQSGNYITGTQTGFLYFLNPGTYTTIISGNENDFLYTENSFSGKNQNIHLLSMDVNFVTGEKLQEIYIENQDKIWASYLLGETELAFESGYNSLNSQNPIAFTIDFERNLSGQVDSPFLFYREVSGIYEKLCTPKIITLGIGGACTTSFCLICEEGGKLYNEGKKYIDVPKQFLPFEEYGAMLTYYQDPDQNTYRVALDEMFILACCNCKKACGNVAEETQYILDNPTVGENQKNLYSGVFFLDELNPSIIDTKYNINYYSGQIAVNSFYEGDKITFKQYTFDFEKVYTALYNTKPAFKEYTTEFIFSNSLVGNNYFSGKQDLINKINYKLASSGLYSWKPLKYNKVPEFEYAPLITGIDGGIDISGNNIINLISLRSGKFGSHDIKLFLQPRLQIYNYLVPNIIKLEISDDFVNWTGVVTSENRQPVNSYIKSKDAALGPIKYDEIPNTKYTIEKTIPTSSEIENLVPDEDQKLEDLLKKFKSGNFTSGSYVCILNPTGSGINCGTGYQDYFISSSIGPTCELKGIGEGETGKREKPQEQENETKKKENDLILTEEINRFRIGFYDYLS